MGEFLREARIGPNRLAFIAKDATRESTSPTVLADPYAAEPIAANRAVLDVDQKRLRHRRVTE